MYWLEPGITFKHKELVRFAGLHLLQQQVYHFPKGVALALLVQQPVQKQMEVDCTGKESIISLRMAKKRLSYVRVVSLTASVYMYHGVWITTDITVQSPEQAVVSMLQMPHVCSEN